MLRAIVDNLDDVAPEFQPLYTERNGKFEITKIEGMRTQADVDRVTISLTKERHDHKETKKKFEPLAEFDIEDVIAKIHKFPELEAAASGKIDEPKMASIIEGRVNAAVGPIKKKLEAAETTVKERDGIIADFKSKERNQSIKSAVTTAARKANVQETAIEDAVILAERVFEVNESGEVVVKDSVGFTPGIDATVWLTELQPKRPHWWGDSIGGGAKGGGGSGKNIGSNPWAHDSWNMTEQGAILRENPTRAESLAKSAGTTVGGAKPPSKK